MERLLDPNFWTRQWEAFLSAPAASIILLVIGCVVTWWVHRKIYGERIGVLEQRLSLAREQMQIALEAKSLSEIRRAQNRVMGTLQAGEGLGGVIIGPGDL